MKNKKVLVLIIVVFIIGVAAGYAVKLNNSTNHKKIVSGYSFEVSNKNIINKKLDGKYLDSFVTVVNPQNQFVVNLEEISPDSSVFIIDPTDGNMMSIKYNDGKFSTEINLNKDINYGIIMDYNLIGSIRVVEDIKNIDEDKLFSEILIGLGCGL